MATSSKSSTSKAPASKAPASKVQTSKAAASTPAAGKAVAGKTATSVAIAGKAAATEARTSTGAASPSAAPITSMAVGTTVDTVLLLERKDVRPSRGESPFLLVELSDSTGHVAGVQFDYAPASDNTVVGEPVRVGGVVEIFRGERRLKIRSIAPASDADPRTLVARSRIPATELNQRFATAVNAIPDRVVREAVKRVLRDGGLYARFREAPLSATGYGAWIGGAIEHTLAVIALVEAACSAHPEIDRTSVVAAAILHQLGCVDAFEWDPTIVLLGRARRIPRGVLSSYRIQSGFGDSAHRGEMLDRIEDLVVGSSAGVLSADAPRGESLEHVVLLGAIEMAYAVGRRAVPARGGAPAARPNVGVRAERVPAMRQVG